MKKVLLFASALLFCALPVIAQPQIQYSQQFDEPENGWSKILQLSNGNTFLFNFTNKDGIDVTVYDSHRDKIAHKMIKSDLWDPKLMKLSMIEGIYEIGGQPVIFLFQTPDRTPSLYRIILDPNTGELVKENRIAHIKRYKAGAIWALGYGHVAPSNFYVEKDPYSDCYAVVSFYGMAHETGHRIKVIHYNGEHKKISKAYYDSPDGQFKYLNYLGMCVVGNKSVYVCTYGYNSRKDKDASSARIIVSKLGHGDSTFTHKLLEFSEDFSDTRAVMKYNKNNNTIYLLTLTYLTSKHNAEYYLPMISFIDPETMFITSSKIITSKHASQYIDSLTDKQKGFSGLPQAMIINDDNTASILMEENTQQVYRDKYGNISSAITKLGNIGISVVNPEGKEINGCAIPKAQAAAGLLGALYVSERGNGFWSYNVGSRFVFNHNAFMSFDYINTKDNKYILFNDYPENFDRDGSKKPHIVGAVSKSNTVCYKFNNSSIVDKFYLFGQPEDKNESTFCYIESSDYNKKNHTYATMVVKRDGRKKEAHIAWVTF